MTQKKRTLIQDKKSKVWGLSLMRKLFIKQYYNQGFVYIEDDKPTYCSDVVRWLDKLEIESTSQKQADKLSWEYFREKYPQYGKYVQLY